MSAGEILQGEPVQEGLAELVLRDVEVGGRAGLDVAVKNGRIAAIGPRLACRARDEIDGDGGALLPGLVDHHLHLFALAAASRSTRLEDIAPGDEAGFVRALAIADAALPSGAWLRGVGYHERVAGLLDRDRLDALVARRPVRIQHASGQLWMLNSHAIDSLPPEPWPQGVERDARGRATGRIYREDRWLRALGAEEPPPLDSVARALDRFGVTGVTDASPATDEAAARALAAAARRAGMRQRLVLMSAGPLRPPDDGAYAVGPVKVLLDEHRLGGLELMSDAIASARAQGRGVAVHCVTAVELAFALAAWAEAGAGPHDRIEHGAVIAPEAATVIAELGLTVVTQPSFILERGDRYLAEVQAIDHDHLYPCGGLIRAGVKVAASSDAPYGDLDPWAAMRTAVRRRTRAGRPLGPNERVSARQALALYLGGMDDPSRPRRVTVGAAADLCLMGAPIRAVLGELSCDLVQKVLIAGASSPGAS